MTTLLNWWRKRKIAKLEDRLAGLQAREKVWEPFGTVSGEGLRNSYAIETLADLRFEITVIQLKLQRIRPTVL